MKKTKAMLKKFIEEWKLESDNHKVAMEVFKDDVLEVNWHRGCYDTCEKRKIDLLLLEHCLESEEENESKLTEEELNHCDKMLQGNWEKEFSYAGSFQTALMKAIERADRINLKKIHTVYPSIVTEFIKNTINRSLKKRKEAE